MTRPNKSADGRWGRRILWRTIAAIAWTALFLPVARALDPARDLLQYNYETWGRQNGLPANGIHTITQTADGYLWLGTQSGLIRFDGVHFIQYSLPPGAPFRSNVISSVAPAARGGLWFGVTQGTLGYCTADGEVSPVADVPWIRPDSNVILLSKSHDGALWVATDEGLGRCDEANPKRSTFDVTLPPIRWISEDSSGRQWLVTTEQDVWYRENGKMQPFPDAALKQEQVIAADSDPSGRIWIGTTTGLHCYDAAMRRVTIPPFPHEVKVVYVDRHGVLWVGTSGDGLACFKGGQFQFFSRRDGLPDDVVTALFEDREGSLWIGTRAGLSQLSDVKFPIYSEAEGLIGGPCHGVSASPRGGLWIGFSQGVSYFDGHEAKNYTVANSGLSYRYIKRIYEAQNGDVYLINGRKGLDILANGHVVASFACNNWPTALAEDGQGMIVSIGGTLFRASRSGLAEYEYKPGQTPSLAWIRDLTTSRDGALWIASVDGILRVQDGAVQRWTTASGLASDDIYSLSEDDDGTVWAGTTAGLARIKDGLARHVTRANGLYDDFIYAVVPDGVGDLWLNSSRGIFRVSLRELNDVCDGRTSHVVATAYNGLNVVKTVDSIEVEYIGCRTNDGRVWFPTPLGPVAITPARIPVDRTIPPVRIENLRANGVVVPLAGNHIVPPGGGELEFRYTALSFVAPEAMEFRYRLEGFEKNWVDAGSRREAFYTNLPPGHYVFHVLAANADGVWNETGDSIWVELQPHFYQTPWFILLSSTLVVAALAFAFWRRTLRRKREREAQERNRIMLENEVRVRTADLQRENTDRQKAESALRISERFLHSLLQSLPVQVLRNDRTGRITFANQRFCTRHGVTPEQVVGRTLADFWPPAQAERHRQTDAEVLATGSGYDGVEAFPTDQGAVTFNRIIKVPVYADDGTTIAGVQAMLLDVTEQKRAEEKLAEASGLLEMMLNNTPDTIYFKDLQSRFVRVSRSKVEAMLQRRPNLREIRAAKGLPSDVPEAELLNGLSDFDMMTREDAQQAFDDEQRIIARGESVIGKLEKQKYLDGTERWHLTSKMPMRDGQNRIIGSFGISKDITNLKEAEERLEQLNRQLRDTSRQAGMAEVATGVLHNVGNVLNSVNVSATLITDHVKHTKSANLAKLSQLIGQNAANLGDFMTNDPRGKKVPEYLATISDLLEHERRTILEELEHLRKNVEHIKEIVAMQQSYARMSGITETVSVPDMIEDALRMNAGSLARHDVDTVRDYQARPVITTDKHKVMQILINLVRNAKYACDESGRTDKVITVRATADGHRVRIEVTDNGVGIPAENLTRIFAHGFTTRKHGHGFGLHSGALAAKELGGSLTVHSDGPGKGATFILELPYKPQHPDDESTGQ